MKIVYAIFITSIFMVSIVHAKANTPGHYYVIAEALNVRLNASTKGKVTNTLSMNQKVEVFEVKNGWARISKYYDGVAEGISGKVARWTSAKYLSSDRPTNNKLIDYSSPLTKAISSSQDYSKNKDIFLSVSAKLIDQRECKLSDFEEMGGWMRSSNHKPKPIYFTYCSAKKANDRIYLDATTGKLYR